MKNIISGIVLLIISFTCLANPNPSTINSEQTKVVDYLTQSSIKIFDGGSIFSLWTKGLYTVIEPNNPSLSSCLNNQFSQSGYTSFKKAQITNYILTTSTEKLNKDIALVTPEVVYALSKLMNQAINKQFKLGLSNNTNNIALSSSGQDNLRNLFFSPEYKSIREAVLVPINATSSDNNETFKLKAEGAGGELGIRYMAWGFKQCGL